MINWKIPDEDTFYLNEKEKARLENMGEPDFDIVKKWIKSYNGVIDIGAHIGETSYRYSKYFKEVYAFEPLYYDILRENIGHIKNIKVYPVAAADKDEDLVMIRSTRNSGASCIKTTDNNEWLKNSRFSKKEYAVKSIAIDSLKLEGIDFIKIDTEGYVLPVLKGLQDTIVRTGYPLLQIEFNWMTINRTGCESVLKELGYVFIAKFDNIDFFYIHSSRR